MSNALARIADQLTPQIRRITDREMILALLRRHALTAREISERTGISIRVVRVHLAVLRRQERLITIAYQSVHERADNRRHVVRPSVVRTVVNHYRSVV